MALSDVGAKRTGQHRGGKPQKYFLSEADRNLMRAVYANPEYGSVSESIDYLEQKLGMPRDAIKNKAHDMGLARKRDDYWTPEEIAYLEENYQRPSGKRASIASIAKHLGRTNASIRLKAKRMKFRRTQGDAYTVRSLADALGCDWHTVGRWIDKGWLVATRDLSREDDRYSIKPEAIRKFIIAYPTEIDHRRCEWIWLLDILVGSQDIGKLDERGKRA